LVADLLGGVIATAAVVAAVQKGFLHLTARAGLQTRAISTAVAVRRGLSSDLRERVFARLSQRVLFAGLIEFAEGRYLVK